MLKFLNKNKIIFWICLLCIVGVEANCQLNSTNQLTKTELKIYETLIDEKSKVIITIDNSIPEKWGINKEVLKKTLNLINNDTSENFLKILKYSSNIKEKFFLDSDNLIISNYDLDKTNLESKSNFIFSRIGFSNDGHQAIVWCTKNANSLGMSGGLYLLNKEKAVWKIEQKSVLIKN
jgi:hypothetical protein